MLATTTTTEQVITYRLPKPGKGDPFWGFSRSFHYAVDKRLLAERGEKLLIHICGPGKTRGVTLVVFKVMEAFVHRQMEAQNGEAASEKETAR